MQAFGTADLGMVAFETPAREGMVVNEDLILEIVRPGSGDTVAPVMSARSSSPRSNSHHPWIRLALGDLTAALPGVSACARTNMPIKGWMGRADQRPRSRAYSCGPTDRRDRQRHPGLGRLRLVVTREGETDLMTRIAPLRASHSEANSSRRCAPSPSSAARSNWCCQQLCRTMARSYRTNAVAMSQPRLWQSYQFATMQSRKSFIAFL